jgi:cell division protein FtsZ
MVDPSANIIFGTVVDPRVGDEIHMTVIATGFAPRAVVAGDPLEATRSIRDYGLPGVSNMDDAELPAFLRRNIRSLNSSRPLGEGSVARLAERR